MKTELRILINDKEGRGAGGKLFHFDLNQLKQFPRKSRAIKITQINL